MILEVVLAFLTVFLVTPHYIKFLKSIGMTGRDINKKSKEEIPEMGAIPVLMGFLAGLFLLIGLNKTADLVTLFAVISTVLIITIIGMMDDITNVGKKLGIKRVGLRQWQKAVLPLFAAVPLMAIKAGTTTMAFPFIGSIEFGIFYPLLLVPIGIVGAASAVNMLAGFNGLEAGMGFLMTTALGIFAAMNGEPLVSTISFIFAAAIIGFFWYNKYPAKIFPGDSITYMVGAVVAAIAIIGNIERFALIIFFPYFIEFILKLRIKFQAETFGELQEDGTLKAPKGKSYSLTHVVMKLGRFKEWQVTYIILGIELFFIVVAFGVSSL